jgi:hypothetical protein
MSTVETRNSDQEIGYLKGKLETYEKIFPLLYGSLMQLITTMMEKEREKERQAENPLSAIFGSLVNIPQFQEHMKRTMDQEREKFEKEHNLGRPSI